MNAFDMGSYMAHWDASPEGLRHKMFWGVVRELPTDYVDYGGEVERWAKKDVSYPDCSCGCRHWYDLGGDWGICCKPDGERHGMLTWEHQAGFTCFEAEDDDEE